VMIAIAATNVPRVIKRIGPKPILVVGPLLIAVSLFLLAHVPLHGSYLHNVLPGLILLGLGGGMSFVAGTITATTGVPTDESGLASGLLNTTQQLGGSLGLAILAGIATSRALKAIKHLPAHQAVSTAAAYAQVQGFHAAFYVGVGFAVGASLVAAFLIQQPKNNAATTETVPAAAVV
jgi:MFS family permease